MQRLYKAIEDNAKIMSYFDLSFKMKQMSFEKLTMVWLQVS